jgi:hypothetical protein
MDFTLTLPHELLSYIFSLLIDPSDDIVDTKKAPLLTAQVCGRWRDAAHFSPHLWSTITLSKPDRSLDLGASGQNSWATAIAHKRSVLERVLSQRLQLAQNCPLRIDTQIGGGVLTEDVIFQALWPRRHLWKSFAFEFNLDCNVGCNPMWKVMLSDTSKVDLHLPMLQNLDLSIIGSSPEMPWTAPLQSLLSDAPVLTSLALDVDFTDLAEGGCVSFPWHQLKDVRLSGQNTHRLPAFFARLSRLTTMTVNLPGYLIVLIPETPQTPFLLPLLQNLTLFIRPPGLESTMAQLTARSLHTLTVDYPSNNISAFDTSLLTSFINRSGCQLQELTGCGSTFVAEGVLQLLPSLRRLRLVRLPSGSFMKVFSLLSLTARSIDLDDRDSPREMGFLPRLERLRLEEEEVRNEGAEKVYTRENMRFITDMLQARWYVNSHGQLKGVELRMTSAADDWIAMKDEGAPSLERLEREGMEMTMTLFGPVVLKTRGDESESSEVLHGGSAGGAFASLAIL